MHIFLGLIIALIAAVWVAYDARKRGMNSVGWAIGTFLLLILFLPLYLILRKPVIGAPIIYPPGAWPPGPVHQCRNCGENYGGEVYFCPHCGAPQA